MRVFWFTNGSPQAWQEAVQASNQARQSMPLKTGSAARLPGLPLGQGSRWRGQQRVFLLMRIIYHHYINLINVMGPVQREEITGH